MMMTPHVSKICSSAYMHPRDIDVGCVRPFLSQDTTERLKHAFVTYLNWTGTMRYFTASARATFKECVESNVVQPASSKQTAMTTSSGPFSSSTGCQLSIASSVQTPAPGLSLFEWPSPQRTILSHCERVPPEERCGQTP